MAQTAAELAGPCLEKICEIASGRKYTKLRHEAKVGISLPETQGCVMSNAQPSPALFMLNDPCSRAWQHMSIDSFLKALN